MKEIFQFFQTIGHRLDEKPIEGASIGAGGWVLYKIKTLLLIEPVSVHDWLFAFVADTTGICALIIAIITAFFSLRKLLNKKLWDTK